MTRLDPVRSPVLDTLREHRQRVDAVEPPAPPGSPGWLRLAAVGIPSLAFVLLFHFPPLAVLVFPLAGLATQSVRRWRWPYRAACSVVFAGYAAQIVRLADYPWLFRFAASFALFMAAAFFWGLRMDEFE